ncbi:MAG: 30S ribosomal protein S6 [Clostridia bacterium]|nr:30S ribosomal protein S6 [Clostridia bacterium]
MNKYELVYIIDPAVEEEARKALIARFNTLITDNGGTVDKVEEWGKRRLAYAINYKTEGYYVLVNFSSEATLPLELERNLKINDRVIRYQVIHVLERKVGIKPRAPRPQPVAPEAPAAAAEPAEAPAAPAPEAEAAAQPDAE